MAPARPARAARQAGDGQQGARQRNAGEGGSARIEAGGAGRHAEHGARLHQRDQQGHDNGDDEADMQPGAGHQLGQHDVALDRHRLRPAEGQRALHRAFNHHRHEQQDDEVQEQRGDHLVDAEAQTQQHRTEQQQRTDDHARGHDDGDRQNRRQSGDGVVAEPGGGQRAGVELALGADVPQPGAEGDGRRKTDQHQRRCRVRVSEIDRREPKAPRTISP